ncbi:MAG: DUF4406 domain-containing protein [bacterium]|nr:DUF4406 domain-containing protein [bacterium]
MKKLFISQPMRGKSDKEILEERERAIKTAKAFLGEDVEVIDTFYTDFSPEEKPLEYLARSISDLAKADVAYFTAGWQDARGCRIEYTCAVEYGIDRIE